MSESESQQKYFQPKPKTEEGFKEPVSWLGGRELISNLKWIAVYSIFGESFDPRSWMKTSAFPKVDETDLPHISKKVNRAWADKVVEYWNWKRERFTIWEEYLSRNSLWTTDENGENEISEFWFDYIADSGDGQQGVYGVGCLCLSDLWLESEKVDSNAHFSPKDVKKDTLLPRGSFLFVGGDTAYHVADYSALHERFQNPFRWAFMSVRRLLAKDYNLKPTAEKHFIDESEVKLVPKSIWKENSSDKELVENWDGTLTKESADNADVFRDTEPPRPLFAIPANHDYYNDIDGFNRLFRRPPFETVEENKFEPSPKDNLPLRIPTFCREQEASYVALRLPFDWWFFGIDSENEKLDFRQKIFFKEIFDKWKPRKLIISTSEPTTVFGRKADRKDKTAEYVATVTESLGLEQPFFCDGRIERLDVTSGVDTSGVCRLDLSGDVHHYARYWGPEHEKDGQKEFASDNYASLVSGGGGAFFDATETLIGKAKVTKKGKEKTVRGEIPPQTTFPDADCSREATANRLFDLWNIKKGGYVQIAGAALAVIFYFCLTYIPHIHLFFQKIKLSPIGTDATGAVSGVLLLASIIFFYFGGKKTHDLVGRLKVDRGKDANPDPDNGRIKQLRLPLSCFVFGAALYLIFLFYIVMSGRLELAKMNAYTESFLLLLNLVIVGLLIWMSVEYTNWLPIRFKFSRQFGTKPDGWIDILGDTSVIGKIDETLTRDSLIRRIWESIRKQSIEYVPVYILNAGTIAVLVLGVYLFGRRSTLLGTGADLGFTLLMLGGFVGILFLAYSLGASYQKGAGKSFFLVIGFCHAVLQLLTPFVLAYYGDWRFVVFVFVLTIFTNGFSGFRALLKFLIPDVDKSKTGWKKTLWSLTTLRFAAWVMKQGKAGWLFFAWIAFGLIVLGVPFLMLRYCEVRSVGNVAVSLVNNYAPFGKWWLPVVLMLVVAGYIGNRMSRVWFSWYLAVSLAFNGHNNEAGGAARIEGFKHILRIKVEQDKLTVYVIGFKDAQIELDDLKPVLVDKFELFPT
jgi:hypothetical protein